MKWICSCVILHFLLISIFSLLLNTSISVQYELFESIIFLFCLLVFLKISTHPVNNDFVVLNWIMNTFMSNNWLIFHPFNFYNLGTYCINALFRRTLTIFLSQSHCFGTTNHKARTFDDDIMLHSSTHKGVRQPNRLELGLRVRHRKRSQLSRDRTSFSAAPCCWALIERPNFRI